MGTKQSKEDTDIPTDSDDAVVYLPHLMYLIACNQCRIIAGPLTYKYIDNEVFHLISIYSTFPDFKFHPHDKLDRKKNRYCAYTKSSPPCCILFGPALNKKQLTENNMKYHCEFIPEYGNIGVAIVPSKWKDDKDKLHTYFNTNDNYDIAFVYQNGYCQSSYKIAINDCENGYFITSGQKVQLEIDVKACKMTVFNHNNSEYPEISVSFTKDHEDYHIAFELGNAPAQITVNDQWWSKNDDK